MTHVALALWLLVLLPGAAPAQPPPPPPVVASAVPLASVTLVKSSDGRAVVRAGGALHVLRVGARVGQTEARVTEIAEGRLVLEEVTTGPDGKPARARIVLRDGETGGRRFSRDPGTAPPAAVRPEVIESRPVPDRKPTSGSGR